jgi:hypothetical protein
MPIPAIELKEKHGQINSIDIPNAHKSNVTGIKEHSHYKVVHPIIVSTQLCMHVFWYDDPCTVSRIPMYSPNANAKTHAYKE